ncbi:peptidylprolyl isomerase [Halalkalibacter lacteus]|uniref:peptidylprolyl isomerase n=1 Tax=Halalkalibacter lacteus TaxID=3090663 RepID=UPI002FC66828
MRRILSTQKAFFVLLAALLFMFAGCGTQSDEEQVEEQLTEETEEQTGKETDYPIVEENPIVTITMEGGDEIVLELYPDIAPNTVANFISLVEDRFFDGGLFHRVIPGFMIQGGDPVGDGSGGPGYSIEGEFNANGFENPIKHERGVLSMARANDPNSAGSQFFIMVEESPHLNGQYAGFGRVLEGMETVDEIVHAERDYLDKPVEEQRVQKMIVDTKGYDYPEPEKR